MIFTNPSEVKFIRQNGRRLQKDAQDDLGMVELIHLVEASNPFHPNRDLETNALLIRCCDKNKLPENPYTYYYLYLPATTQYGLAIELIRSLYKDQLTEHDVAQVIADLTDR